MADKLTVSKRHTINGAIIPDLNLAQIPIDIAANLIVCAMFRKTLSPAKYFLARELAGYYADLLKKAANVET